MCCVAPFLHLLLSDGIFIEVLTFFKNIYIYFFVAQLVPLTYSSAHPGAHQIFINAERLESNTPIRPFWKSKSPSRCTPLSAGQRLLLCYWSLHRRRGGVQGWAVDFSISTVLVQAHLKNNTPPRRSFMMSEVCEALPCAKRAWKPSCSWHWRCNIISQHISADMRCALWQLP